MVKTPVFKGSCTAIVTPFHEHGVDYDRLKRNLDFQFENGTAAVVVVGPPERRQRSHPRSITSWFA